MTTLASDRWEPLRHGPPAPLLRGLSNEDLDTLARCAVAGTFDEEMFDELLYAGGRSLTEFERLYFVVSSAAGYKYLTAPLGGADGAFWSLWPAPEVPFFVRELSAKLAEYYRVRAPRPLERTRHLLLSDSTQSAAREEFSRLFREKDAEFDIPGCWDLLAILDDPTRSRRLSPQMMELREKYRLRALMRSAFYDDYLLTEGPAYLSRPALEESLGAVLEEDAGAPGLLFVRGIGGTGKTTLLRWFASRRCVGTDPDAVLYALCVRIDGSVARTEELLDRPWLILIEAAAQLRRLTQYDALDVFLDEYGDHQGRLLLGPGAAASFPVEPDPGELARLFANSLIGPDGKPGPRIVLLLDNMDDLYLWGSNDEERLNRFFSLLEQVHGLNADIRVVVAGRHDFDQALPRLRDLGYPMTKVEEFTREEVELVLGRRGIVDPATVHAIFERSGALPYVVAGFTVLFDEGRVPPTPDEIRSSSDPVIDYLSLRIVEQIVDPVVRWILRYACVPNVFDREFVADAMLPVLRDHPDGDVREEFDKPVEKRRGRGPVRPRDAAWEIPAADDEERLGALWSRVREQLRALPWFSAEGGAFTVERDLRRALRSQVAGHKAVWLIHQRAMGKCLAEAESAALSPDEVERRRWLELTQGAAYHAVRANGLEGFDIWREGVRTARSLGRLDWAERLTEFVIIEFELAAPAQPDLAESAYEAYLELARICVQRAGMLPGGPRPRPSARWSPDSECARRLKAARLARAALSDVLPRAEERILDVLEQTRAEDAARDIPDSLDPPEQTPESGPAAELLRDLWLAEAGIARVRTPDDPRPAQRGYRYAFEYARRAGSGAAWVAAEAAAWHLAQERTDRALTWCLDAAKEPDDPYAPDREATWDLRRMRVQLLLDLGRPSEALDAIADCAALSPDGSVPALLAVAAAEVHVALCQPLTALQDLVEPGFSAEDGEEGMLAVRLTRARINGLLLNYGGADAELDRAEKSARTGPPAWRARVAVARAWLEFDCTGNLPLARHALAADFDQLPPDAPERLDLELARVELARQSNDAETLVERLAFAEEIARRPGGSRAERIRVLCARLSADELLRLDDRIRAMRDLLSEATLEALHSRRPRLRLFASLGRCKAPATRPDVLVPMQALLRDLLPSPDFRDSAPNRPRGVVPRDQAYQHTVLADFRRVFGDKAAAVSGQEWAAHILAKQDPFIHWCRLDATWRVGAEPLRRQPDPAVFQEHYRRHPQLVSAMLCEWVTTYDPDASSVEGEELLSIANTLATDSRARPSWYQVRLHERLAERSSATPEAAAQALAQARRIRAQLGHTDRPRSGSGPGSAAFVEFVEAPWGLQIVTSAPGRESTTEDVPTPAAVAETARGFVQSLDRWRTDLGGLPSASLETRLRDFGGRLETVLGISCTGANFAAQPWELLPVEGVPAGRHAAIGGLVRHHTSVPLEEGRARLAWRLLERYYQQTRGDGSTDPALSGLASLMNDYARERRLSHDEEATADPHLMTRVVDDLALGSRRQRELEPRALRVWILTPAVGGSMRVLDHFHRRIDSVGTAYRSAAGTLWPVVRVFQRQGVEAQAFAEGAASVVPQPADIVHVCGVVRNNREFPVLGDDGPEGPLSARALAQAVRRLTGAVPPLVVLDFTSPENPSALRRNLLVRNRFAHQLLALGGIDTIIATGFEQDRETRQLECLAAEIAGGGNAASICRELRAIVPAGLPAGPGSGGEVPDSCLPYWGTALFSSLPVDAIHEPGLFT